MPRARSRINLSDLGPSASAQVTLALAADHLAGKSKRTNKYGAERTLVDGIDFDSQADARRFGELRMMERAGEITGLELQPEFPVVIGGVTVCVYRADFSYFAGNARVTEDVKGHRTALYILKRKLVEAAYPGLKIIEVQA